VNHHQTTVMSPLDCNVSIYKYVEWTDQKSGTLKTGYVFSTIDTLRNVLTDNDQAERIIGVRNGTVKKNTVLTYTPAGCWDNKIKRTKDTPPISTTNQVQIDIDALANPSINEIKDDLFSRFPSITAIGTSVGGLGLFVLFNTDGINYEASFRAICKDLEDIGIEVDDAVSSINELRYMTLNNDVIVREDPEVYVKKIEFKKKPSTYNNDNFDGVFSIKLPANFHYKDAVQYIGISNLYGVNKEACLSEVIKDDVFSPKSHMYNNHEAIKGLVEKMYGRYKEQFGTRKMPKKSVIDDFWVIVSKQEIKKILKDDDNGDPITTSKKVITHKVIIKKDPLLSFLSNKGGFYLFYADQQKLDYRIIRISSRFVENSTVVHIKKFLIDYINSISDTLDDVIYDLLIEEVISLCEKQNIKSLLEMLPDIDIDFIKSTKDTALYPFKNGLVKVTDTSVELIDYSTVDQYVWKSQVIQHDYINQLSCLIEDVEFYQFIAKVCADDYKRIAYMKVVIGYLIHLYKDPAKPFSIILAEEHESEDLGGGTGKGIFFRAIGKILRDIVVVDGKNFKHDKPFLFQRADISTQIIVIDDCKKDIDFTGFYSHITEGLTIEKKNRGEIHVDYSMSPKFIFSTNYTINLDGEHAKRRARIVEFSDFFNTKYTPEDHFGHLLFSDWDETEWNNFYYIMFQFVSQYLQDGMHVPEQTNSIKRKEVAQRFSRDFLDFWDQEVKKDGTAEMIKEKYDSFLSQNELQTKDYSYRKFSKALKITGTILGDFRYDDRKVSVKGGKREFFIVKIEPE
jgi:hypothetical protein